MSKEHEIEPARDTRVRIQVTQTVNLDPKGPSLAKQFERCGRININAKLLYMTVEEACDILNATAITLSLPK